MIISQCLHESHCHHSRSFWFWAAPAFDLYSFRHPRILMFVADSGAALAIETPKVEQLLKMLVVDDGFG